MGPSRATGAAGKQGAPGIAFMPFSEGPRNCVGQTLAKAEVVSVLVALLGAFRVELAPEVRTGAAADGCARLLIWAVWGLGGAKSACRRVCWVSRQ